MHPALADRVVLAAHADARVERLFEIADAFPVAHAFFLGLVDAGHRGVHLAVIALRGVAQRVQHPVEHAHPVRVDERDLILDDRGTRSLEIGDRRVAGFGAPVEIGFRQVPALELLDQADAFQMIRPARGHRHVVHPGREGTHFFGEAGPGLPVDGVLHEVPALLLRIAQRPVIRPVPKQPAERVALKDHVFDQGFDVFHLAPFQALRPAEQLVYVSVGNDLALLQLHEKADRATQVLIVDAVVVGDLAPMGDFGPIAHVQRPGAAPRGQIFGMPERLARVFGGLVRLVAFDLVAAVTRDVAVGRADLRILVVLLDPVVGAHLIAPEQRALVVAPEVAADALIHFDRAQRAAALEAVRGLVGVQLLPEAVRPFEQMGRVLDLDALRALRDDGLQVLRAHHPATATARVNAPAVRHHAGDADLVFAGLSDGQRIGFGRIVAQLVPQRLVRLGAILAPQVGRVADGDVAVADVDVHRPRGLAGHDDVIVAAEPHDVGELAAARRVAERPVTRALERQPALDADPRTDAGERPHPEDQHVVRPARVAHDVVLQEMLPEQPVVDTRAAHPAFEHGMRQDFAFDFPTAEIHPEQSTLHDAASLVSAACPICGRRLESFPAFVRRLARRQAAELTFPLDSMACMMPTSSRASGFWRRIWPNAAFSS